MGLYLGSTKIPTISFYKSGAIMPSGIFNIPSEPTISTRCYATLTTLEAKRNYFKYNGITYKNSGDSFEFTAGNTLSIEVYGEMSGANIYEDGQKIGTCDSNQPYNYTLPSHEITINTSASGTDTRVNISSVLTSTYDVTSYAFAQGDFGYGRLSERISGDILEYSNSTASTIASWAFPYTNISLVSMPNVTIINQHAFGSCSKLISVNFPSCTNLGAYAFNYCSSLTTASFPECTSIGANAFMYARSLTSAYFPKVTYVGTDAFWYCSRLTSFSMSLITSLGNYAFEYCHSLESAYLPKLTSRITYECFWYCSALSSIYAPSATGVEAQGLACCWALSSVSFPCFSFISSSAFQSCYNLLSVYLMSTSVVSLGNINAFSSTPISGYTSSTGGVYGSIYVPASLLASYKAATNWVNYSDRIVGV